MTFATMLAFSQAASPLADREYRRLWPNCTIQRLSNSSRGVHLLDKYFGIDVILRLPNGQPITVQEKFRDPEALRKYNDFTLEYYNDPATREEGEWFHLYPDLYFYAYADDWDHPSRWLSWYLLEVLPLKMALNSGRMRMRGPKQNTRESRANFLYLPWSQVSPSLILASDRHPELCYTSMR